MGFFVGPRKVVALGWVLEMFYASPKLLVLVWSCLRDFDGYSGLGRAAITKWTQSAMIVLY